MTLETYNVVLDDEVVFIIDRAIIRKDKNAQRISRSEWIRETIDMRLKSDGLIEPPQY